MRIALFFFVLSCLANTLSAQNVYTIKADSVKLTNYNCDSTELIIENHTQTVRGFLFNTGNGRTVFKRGVQKINDSFYLIGADTLKLRSNAWVQGGNTFGATGILGTLDSNHLDFYTNNKQQARMTSRGNFLLGTAIDSDYRFSVIGKVLLQTKLQVGNGVNLGAVNAGESEIINSPFSDQNGGLMLNATNGTFQTPHLRFLSNSGTQSATIYSDANRLYFNLSSSTAAISPNSSVFLFRLDNRSSKFAVTPNETYLPDASGYFKAIWDNGYSLLAAASSATQTADIFRVTSYDLTSVYLNTFKSGNVGIKTTVDNGNALQVTGNASISGTMAAQLRLPAGSTAPGTASFKFSAPSTNGVKLTTPEDGAVEYDGIHYYSTVGTARYQLDRQSISGSFSQAASATTTFTVTIGSMQANNTYKVDITPTASITAAPFYVTNKTTSTFDVVYLAGLTGTATFDWALFP